MIFEFWRHSRRFGSVPTGTPGIADFVYVQERNDDDTANYWSFSVNEHRYRREVGVDGNTALRVEFFGDSFDAADYVAAMIGELPEGTRTLDDVEAALRKIGAVEQVADLPTRKTFEDALDAGLVAFSKILDVVPDHGIVRETANAAADALVEVARVYGSARYFRARDLATGLERRALSYADAVEFTEDPDRYGPGPWTIETAVLLPEDWVPATPPDDAASTR